MTGQELKISRERYGKTQKEVAEAIGTREQRISEWENGKKNLGKAYSQLLSMYFNKLRGA